MQTERTLTKIPRISRALTDLKWVLREFSVCIAAGYAYQSILAFSFLVCLAQVDSLSAQSQVAATEANYAEALTAIIEFDNARLKDVISIQPPLLSAEDENGQSLIDYAFYHLNDDGAPQTNYVFLKFLIDNNFFGQRVDRANHVPMAVSSLRRADKYRSRKDVTEDMIFHRTRAPLIELLSIVVADSLQEQVLTSEQSLGVIMTICDPQAYSVDDENLLSPQVSNAVEKALNSTHFEFALVYAATGSIDRNCATQFLNN